MPSYQLLDLDIFQPLPFLGIKQNQNKMIQLSERNHDIIAITIFVPPPKSFNIFSPWNLNTEVQT